MENEKDKIGVDFSNETINKASILLELYLEFFAIFIPGFLLVVGLVALLSFVPDFFNYVKKIESVGIHHGYKFFFLLLTSYAVGAILHRQSPERPDEISTILIWKKEKKEKNVTGAVSTKRYWYWCHRPIFFIFPELCLGFVKHIDYKLRRWYGKSNSGDYFIKYPYGCLRNYLTTHGLQHLLKYVPWCTYVQSSYIYRNRAIINEYKTIIKFCGPKTFIHELIRHESSIRMNTSLWHALKHLTRLWWIISVFVSGKFIVKNSLHSISNLLENPEFYKLIIWIFILYVMLRVKNCIERSLHYLRLKEIVTILQQIYLLESEYPKKSLWNNINERYKNFPKTLYKKCNLFPKNQCFNERNHFTEANNKEL